MTMADLEHLLHQIVLKYSLDRSTETALWSLIEEAFRLGLAERRAEEDAEMDHEAAGEAP